VIVAIRFEMVFIAFALIFPVTSKTAIPAIRFEMALVAPAPIFLVPCKGAMLAIPAHLLAIIVSVVYVHLGCRRNKSSSTPALANVVPPSNNVPIAAPMILVFIIVSSLPANLG